MKQHLLSLWKTLGFADIKMTKPLPTGEGVMDEGGFSALEIENLFTATNHANTIIGQSVLFRSLVQPLGNLHDVEIKQRAVEELRNDLPLREAIQHLVSEAAAQEKSFYQLLFGEFLPALSRCLFLVF